LVTRLSVVSGCADRELDAIRSIVDEVEVVCDHDELIAVLAAAATRGVRADVLDAIGHSHAGCLRIGSWLIDDSPQTAASFRQLIRPVLEQLGVRTIRLLGCSTATSERGRAAMCRIARATACSVLGTKRYVSRNDYGRAGFASDEALVDARLIRARNEIPDRSS
jgi:hypothetical protein